MTLNAIDEYDIKRSFEALDEDKINRISVESFHTLFLGLGFQPTQLTQSELRDKVMAVIEDRKEMGPAKSAEDMELFDEELDTDAASSFIPLSVVKEILSQHTREDRVTELEKGFQLVDSNGEGHITIDDLQRLSREVGEPLSEEEARAILLSSGSETTMDKQAFERFFLHPPSS